MATVFVTQAGAGSADGTDLDNARAMSTDVHLTITGGTSRSVTPIISAV